MIKLENIEVVGWEHAIRGMRNPMNSWENSDSHIIVDKDSFDPPHWNYENIDIGLNDKSLMMNLRSAGTDHRKFMRMITVYMDITAPIYWWKEFDTYKVGTVANSCSTMHKIHEKEFTMGDFSHEHLINDKVEKPRLYSSKVPQSCDFKGVLQIIVYVLNNARALYLETKDKKYWWQMIQLLPSSYNQKRTIMLNYEVLANIYKSRKNHKLDEWVNFCQKIKELPYSELITGETEL